MAEQKRIHAISYLAAVGVDGLCHAFTQRFESYSGITLKTFG